MVSAGLSDAVARRRQRGWGSVLACVVALGLLTWVDLLTKDWALSALSSPPLFSPAAVCTTTEAGYALPQRIQTAPRVLIPGYLELRYAENCGAAFGFFDRGPSWLRHALFVSAALTAVLGLLWMYWRHYGEALFVVSVPMIASGALGNLIDRFRLGYVVDFIRVHYSEQLVWPTFNVADVMISVGAALLLIDGLQSRGPSDSTS